MSRERSVSLERLSITGGGASRRIFERVVRLPLRDPRGCLRLALAVAFISWLPLTFLTTLTGTAFSGVVAQPFFKDVTPHVRFLFALPLLILADLIVGPNVVQVGAQFLTSGLVPDNSFDGFESAVEAAVSLRDSIRTELIVLVVAYVTTVYAISRELGTGMSSWLAIGGGTASHLTLAGWWYVLLSVPIYQFFIFRWIVRLFIWMIFLFRVSRLDLEIIPTHPDGAAGLGFVGQALAPTSVIILAASSVLCSSIGTQVAYRNAKIQEFIPAFVFFVVLSVAAFLLPFAAFLPKLVFARRDGLFRYGSLATRYTQLFDRKWVRAEEIVGEELLGTGDIQSLADIGNSMDRVRSMKLVPVEVADLRALLVAAILPAIPLALTQVALKDLLGILAKIFT